MDRRAGAKQLLPYRFGHERLVEHFAVIPKRLYDWPRTMPYGSVGDRGYIACSSAEGP
jgi:hypothetical protein